MIFAKSDINIIDVRVSHFQLSIKNPCLLIRHHHREVEYLKKNPCVMTIDDLILDYSAIPNPNCLI